MRLRNFGSFLVGVLMTLTMTSLKSTDAASSDATSSVSTIRVCANKTTGDLRLLITNACSASERLLTWNKQGPIGARGPQGPTGPSGPQGPTGPSGEDASVATQQVTLSYLGGQTFSGIDCGAGSMTAYKPGYAYWGLFLNAWQASDLQNSSRWTQLRSCEITLKVVAP
jgi:hypothetical protein